MVSTRWMVAAAALLLLASHARADEEGDVEHEVAAEQKPAFEPSRWTEPTLPLNLAAHTYLWEYFKGRGSIGKTWLKSKAKKDDVDADISKYNGEWVIGTPTEVAVEGDYSLVMKSVARHGAIATRLPRPATFQNKNHPFVVQYEVRYEEGQTCGGGYVKLLSEGAEKDLEQFTDKTPYTIMFGPDKCSPQGKVHLIFRYTNPIDGTTSEHAVKQPDTVSSSYWEDHATHLYTLTIHPDGAYTVAVDRTNIMSGNLLKDLVPPVEPPATINDPEDKKPEDWDERAEIEDEAAVKPDDWDENAPAQIVDMVAEMPSDWLEDEQPLIPDPAAKKPEDWDVDMDGEWEPPMIDNEKCKGISGCGEWKRPSKANPEYKGKWRRPRIANPAYKGVWAPRVIDNPNHFTPTGPFDGLAPITALGIELWTMSKDIHFDNILITDTVEAATEASKLTFDVKVAAHARLLAYSGKAGAFQNFLNYAEEKPWLWAVIILVVIVPTVLIFAFCCGKKSTAQSPEAAYRKKDDNLVNPDDEEVPDLVDGEEEGKTDEEVVADLEATEAKREASKSPVRRSARKSSKSPARKEAPAPAKGKSARAAIEEDNSSDEDAGGNVPAPKEEEEPFVPVAKKRTRAKKAD